MKLIHSLFLLLLLSIFLAVAPQPVSASSKSALIVTAHPDDESAMAGAVYRMTHDFGFNVDIALITNGEGGFKYSTLAESIYGIELTKEEIGRAHLPAIRKQELMRAGKIIGLRNYFFLDQKDHRYTIDEREVFNGIWDTDKVKRQLKELIEDNNYEIVFILLPTPKTHGHHKAAGLLTLEVISELEKEQRPAILGASVSREGEEPQDYLGLKNYSLTSVTNYQPCMQFNRAQQFGFNNRLNYKIIVNWLIAEHKSQGTMQLFANQGEKENYWCFSISGKNALTETKSLFHKLNQQSS